jgi:NAD-dependent deacetylase sirtuin 1
MPRIEIFRGLLRALGMKPKRKRTRKYNLTETVDLIRNSKKILILTGAGISVSCGIPDFRSRNGLYAKLAVDFPELPDPQSMFSLNFFKSDPRPFFRFAKEIFPGNFSPSPSHNFIAQLEKDNKMKRLYSQNIDGLEQQAGIEKVIQCHGHFYTAHCLNCKAEYQISELKERILASKVPHCDALIVKHTQMEIEEYHENILLLKPGDPNIEELRTKFNAKEKEPCNGVIKPDIVFFGEPLPSHFHRHMAMDQDDVDLLIVMGSSLKVGPVNSIPDAIDENIPRILSKNLLTLYSFFL